MRGQNRLYRANGLDVQNTDIQFPTDFATMNELSGDRGNGIYALVETGHPIAPGRTAARRCLYVVAAAIMPFSHRYVNRRYISSGTKRHERGAIPRAARRVTFDG